MLENRSAAAYWNTMVSQEDSFEASLQKPLPLVLTETNNFYDGGAPGVSNSYGSALYAYDFVFQASQAGFVTSAFTTLENSSKGYSPLLCKWFKLWSSSGVLRHIHGCSCWLRANAVNNGPNCRRSARLHNQERGR